MSYNWTTAGLGPPLLPWLAILALLALKPNRGWAAWWIWLPLAGLAAGCHWLQLTIESQPSNELGNGVEILLAVPLAWAFGLAALWLLASYLGNCGPFRTLVGNVAVLAAFMMFSFAAGVGWGLGTEPIMSLLDPRHCSATASVGLAGLPMLVPLMAPALVFAAAMMLCGLACRGRYRPFAQWLWLFFALLAGWVAASALLHLFCPSGLFGCANYALFLGIGLTMMAVSFATLLPFLILASASRFFRERLKALLHVKSAAQPVADAAAKPSAVPPRH